MEADGVHLLPKAKIEGASFEDNKVAFDETTVKR
jgi:hypothetical protein